MKKVIILFLILFVTGCMVEPDCDVNRDGTVSDNELRVCGEVELYGPYTDITLPTEQGDLAVRLWLPEDQRYDEGAPITIYVPGGYEEKDLKNDVRAQDMLVISFLFPGVTESSTGKESEGTYDFRGDNCIKALRDVILYAAGELEDSNGQTITEVVEQDILTDNIGTIGVSNGGNLPVATAALYGDEIKNHLDYIIQWETPIASQVATRDLGEIILEPLLENPSPKRGKFFNPRYMGYGKKSIEVNYDDLAYDSNSLFPVFHDGNGDGEYTTIDTTNGPSPDLNQDEDVSTDEDFPLDFYPGLVKNFYSRPVTHALLDNGVLTLANWPSDIGTPDEADAYWDLREAVYLYEDALDNIPDLEGMFLASEEDLVQSNPYKSHIRMALDGWDNNWFKINPSQDYILEVEDTNEFIPDLEANTAPSDWTDTKTYCISEDIDDETYQIAAMHQMADREWQN
ncbi:hypothetical protein HOC80_00255 [archaeon]|nr:hypothetical protein [archaeon]